MRRKPGSPEASISGNLKFTQVPPVPRREVHCHVALSHACRQIMVARAGRDTTYLHQETGVPLQNRVTPDGAIIVTSHRGLMMGNRGGAFHLPDRTLGRRRWATRQWIACRLEFKGRHRAAMMQPSRYTELFFLDEATALAAGHRPCFECRRADAERFAELWARVQGRSERERAPAMDEALHAERLDLRGGKRTFRARRADLPSGTFVRY